MRPGYRPPEDVETYKNRSAEAWKNRGSGGVPGADPPSATSADDGANKSKNAKRREAARKKTSTQTEEADLASALHSSSLSDVDKQSKNAQDPSKLQVAPDAQPQGSDPEADTQKKIRNQLKKLKAVSELKTKKATGEKLSPDQLVKIGKEAELIHDLKKMGYTGTEV